MRQQLLKAQHPNPPDTALYRAIAQS